LPLKIVFKRKKQKKKKAIQSRRTGGKTKRKRNKSRRVAGQPSLPCHYAVVFWLGGAVAVRLTFATFLFFFWKCFFTDLYKIHRIISFDSTFHYVFEFGFH